MGLYRLKFGYRKLLKPFAKYPINPDTLAYAALVISAGTPLLYFFSGSFHYLLLFAVAAVFIRMTLNTLDGVIAIEKNLLSAKGDIINAFPDRYSDIFLFAGISFSPLCNTKLGLLATITVLLVSYSGILGKAVGFSWQNNGPLGKVDRLIALMIFTTAQYIFYVFDLGLPEIMKVRITTMDLFWIWCIAGSQITVFNRLRNLFKEISSAKEIK
ncbi:CDP-alcohol phosphatidyltransferase family protein [candidate division WOR-3 bacterium]|nr:CDP-alcohol phosphatidyltransferase family protein [candidate division WOR-3 bacterium]